MKIQNKNKTVKSMKLIVPIDGTINIDENGVAEVSEKCAEVLTNCTNDWFVAGKTEKKGESKTETTETETSGDGGENDANEAGNGGEETPAVTAKELSGMTVDELKAMCAEAGFPEEEYKNLKKGLLIAYMLKKMNGDSAE